MFSLTGPCVHQELCSSCLSFACSIQTEGRLFSRDNPETTKTELRKCDNLFVYCFFCMYMSLEEVHLHGAIDFAAVKHEVEKVQVVKGCLPWNVISLITQVFGGIKRLHCRNYLGSKR